MIEALLSVGILTILAGMSLPLYVSFHNRTQLDASTEQLAGALRRAQGFARGSNGDSQWGVSLQPGAAVLFKGASYAVRDTTYDETIALNAITPTGLGEVVFSKAYGMPSTSGSIVLTETATNTAKTVVLNAKGLVTY